MGSAPEGMIAKIGSARNRQDDDLVEANQS